MGNLGEFGVAIGAARRVSGDLAVLARMPEETGSRPFAEEAGDRLLADADAALSRTRLSGDATARLRRFAGEFVRTPAE